MKRNLYIIVVAFVSSIFCIDSVWGQVEQEYVPGEIIVKFRQSGTVAIRKTTNSVNVLNSSNLETVFSSIGVSYVENLSSSITSSSLNTRPGRTAKENNTLDGICSLKYDSKAVSLKDAIDRLASCDEVEYAEPNYIVYAMASPGNINISNDPFSGQQWGLNAINMPALWTQIPITDKRPVIAILDTGVDVTHLDLMDNIWTSETNSKIHGWNFVDNMSDINDYNGHGTHCAGIAAAVGNNEIGIIGANPDALIMAVKVMGHDGRGDLSSLIKGINYAIENGADVLSMSLGYYGESKAAEETLKKAYDSAILVAAAGNDNICLVADHQKLHGDRTKAHQPSFPAAYPFVWGVEASDKNGLASFSNFDCDGAEFTPFPDKLYNYELRAPGSNIVSTYLHGQYKSLSGTSMACPLVAGAVSRLIQLRNYSSKEELLGDLIKTSKDNIDVSAAFALKDEQRTPSLQFLTYEIYDITGDKDGECDAGEEITLYPTIRNMYGFAKNIKIKLELVSEVDASDIDIIDGEVDLGYYLDTYGKAKSKNPLKFRISKDCPDNKVFRFVMKATCDNTPFEIVQNLTFVVTNAIELKGAITEDLTLYPNNNYIVTSDLVIFQGVTLTLTPGTVLSLRNGSIKSSGKIIAKGTMENPIQIKFLRGKTGNPFGGFTISSGIFEYVRFESISMTNYSACHFTNCQFYDSHMLIYPNYFNKCNFVGGSATGVTTENYDFSEARANNNFINNANSLSYIAPNITTWALEKSNIFANYTQCGRQDKTLVECNVSLGDNCGPIETPVNLRQSYYGSGDLERVRKGFFDIYNPYADNIYRVADYSTISFEPSTEAHGIVWKVLVNGLDAQDESDKLMPLGIGRHKFEVFFNRPMDKSFPPEISMGVIMPYTQISISEDGEWSEDGRSYTAYLTINKETSSEGMNRIYIYGAKDLEHFEIPEEKYRFNVMVQSAGALETGLLAIPGRGKVSLEWETKESDFPDMQGYNVYRYTQREETYYEWGYDESGKYGRLEKTRIVNDTIQLNKQLLDTDVTTYIDYEVETGKTYFYFVKEMYTDLTQSALSNTVVAKPLAAKLGDANGSGAVDVADVITDVAFISKQNPQPFIFEAADVNGDEEIDIRDIVETINIILQPTSSSALPDASAQISIVDGMLSLSSSMPVGGIQIILKSNILPEYLTQIKGIEQNCIRMAEDKIMYLAYSLSGNSIPEGTYNLLQLGNNDSVEEIILCDVNGKIINCINTLPTVINNKEKSIRDYDRRVVYDLFGRIIYDSKSMKYNNIADWKNSIPKGIYIEAMYKNDAIIQSNKIIINK